MGRFVDIASYVSCVNPAIALSFKMCKLDQFSRSRAAGAWITAYSEVGEVPATWTGNVQVADVRRLGDDRSGEILARVLRRIATECEISVRRMAQSRLNFRVVDDPPTSERIATIANAGLRWSLNLAGPYRDRLKRASGVNFQSVARRPCSVVAIRPSGIQAPVVWSLCGPVVIWVMRPVAISRTARGLNQESRGRSDSRSRPRLSMALGESGIGMSLNEES